MPSIHYKDGYRYQLVEDCSIQTYIRPEQLIDTDYIRLEPDGQLHIRTGYAWDGPSGPTIDTKTFMRSALVHDALYQLMRHRYLPKECRKQADRLLKQICREDGMFWGRSWYVYWGVRIGASQAASQEMRKKVQIAP